MEIKQIQEKVYQFSKLKNVESTPQVRIIDLTTEVGELAKEILKGTDYGKNEFKITENFSSEIGDVFYSLICLANESNISLEESLLGALDKYEKRFSEKNHIGSEK